MPMDLLQTILFDKPIRSVSRPIPILCSDFNTYYVKFPIDGTDHTDLIYESVCKALADYLRIPVPDVAYIEATEHSWSETDFPSLRSKMVGFGSKRIENPDVLSKDTAIIRSKHDFNRLLNPEDLVRIGIFDAIVKNMDRSEENFNLITSYVNGDRIFAIDHVATFGGPQFKGIFKPTRLDDVGKNILRSDYGRSVLHFIDHDRKKVILEETLSLLDNIDEALNVSFEQIPDQWQLTGELQTRISNFLKDDYRNQSIREQFERLFRIL